MGSHSFKQEENENMYFVPVPVSSALFAHLCPNLYHVASGIDLVDRLRST
jgi:hypothetical protein